jgi:hypothetical protein
MTKSIDRKMKGRSLSRMGRRDRLTALRRSCRPQFEPLEERMMLTVIPVTTTADVVNATDGVTSLREAVAIANANPGDTISLSAPGGDYNLDPALGELLITASTGISGHGDTVQVDGWSRAFHIEGSVDVTFSDFTVTGSQGTDGRGGALLVEGGSPTVTLDEMRFINNTADGVDAPDGNNPSGSSPVGFDGSPSYGGAVYFRGTAGGSLTVTNSTFAGNAAVGGDGGRATEATGGNGALGVGGAIYLAAGAARLSIDNSTFDHNEARGGLGGGVATTHPDNIYYGGDGGDAYGGAIAAEGGGVTLADSTFTNNRALAGDGYSELAFGDTARSALLVSVIGPGSNGTAYGGAIVNRAGTLNVSQTGFLANVAAGGRLDQQLPFSGGIGGRSTEHGGDGGSAVGGAIEAGLGSLVVDASAFVGNIAQGAPGGTGGGSFPESIYNGQRFIPQDGKNGGDGGRGGGAAGAAISAGMLGSDGSVTITRSIFAENGALGGDGGSGGSGHGNSNGIGGDGGKGGMGGGASGTLFLSDGAGLYNISDSVFTGNRLAGGNGGQGGQGGFGSLDSNKLITGGDGGDGGNGGFAGGGGITLSITNESVNVRIERTTISANVIAGGWGGSAGHGADSLQFAGSGGRGGNGGGAQGAGVSLGGLGVQATIDSSTIYGNLGLAGDGGNGGSGGSSDQQGGDGGDGGTGGSAIGGGVAFVGGSLTATATLAAATIAGNVLEAGGAGRGGNAGSGYLSSPAERTLPIIYGGRIKTIGSYAIFWNAGYNPFNTTASTAPTSNGLYARANVTSTTDPYDPIAGAAAASVVAGGAAGGAEAGLAVDALLSFLGPAGTAVFGGAAPAAGAGDIVGFSAAGPFLIAGLLIAEGAIFTGLGIYYSIAAGSLDQGFRILYDQLDKPAIGRYDMSTLLFGGTDTTVDSPEPPPHYAGRAGARGTAGDARGGGAFASGAGQFLVGRTILGDNRTITVEPDPTFDQLPASIQQEELDSYVHALGIQTSGPITVQHPFDQRVLVEDLTTRPTDPPRGVPYDFNIIQYHNDDFAQSGITSVASQGANFIGGTASAAFNQPLDQSGTLASPLALKSVGRLALNGGLTPTLKLRDDSPARGAGPQLAAAETAQNGYTWAAGTRADIGAWGGAPNQAPVSTGPITFDVPQGGSLALTADQLLSQITDANGDGLVITSLDTSGLHGSATLDRSGNLVDTATNILKDNSSGVVTALHYTLRGVSFSGDETFTIVVSDGAASTLVPVTIHVLPLIHSVQVGAQTGTATYGDTTHTVTYDVSAVRGVSGTISNATYSISSSELPAAVIAGASFSNNPVSSSGTDPIPGTSLSLSVPNTLAAGTYTFTVTLTAGSASASGTGTLTVGQRALTVTANNLTKTYGDTVTFAGTEFTTSGLVNSDTVSSVSLASAGAAATAVVSGSPYAITASNAAGSGLANYTITYAPGQLTVTPAPTTVALSSSTNTSVPGQYVTFTATVAAARGGTPGGSVTFQDGGSVLATVALSGGSASCAVPLVALGGHSVTASYNPDSNHTASASSALSQAVQPVAFEPGPQAGQWVLYVGGTNSDDTIAIQIQPQTNGPDEALVTIQTKGVAGQYRSGWISPPSGSITRLYAYGLDGNDTITVLDQKPGVTAMLFGGNGNDTITAGKGPTALVGGAGNDTLIGGDGPTLLTGGGGSDMLNAGKGNTILIGGSTDLDTPTPANLAALDQVLSAWSSGGVSAASALLNSPTVHDDGAADVLSSGAGMDWFLVNLVQDTVKKQKTGDLVTETTGS